ncbi:TetR/AcrR family transcriptional regulator [Nonomuraea terrae]|uniref:TetR/AcrR family transcriptional regulator n=1 Tax=Nonomuraea terrae TaxID=2530383 RepID=UPI001CB6F1EB|nr:TetR/AcrR family transcriptional regulator [Nonomuraea terrae]
MLTPRKQPRQQRSRETVAAILEAAAQLFQRHGYGETTTNKIAERAGVSIGSLYQYFPNKDALLVALAENCLAEVEGHVSEVFSQAGEERPGLHGLLTELVRRVADLHTDRPALHRLLYDLSPRTPGLVARFRAAEQRMAAALAAELRRLGAGGPDPELNALLAVQGIEAQIHGALLEPSHDAAGTLPAIVDLWHRALTVPADEDVPGDGDRANRPSGRHDEPGARPERGGAIGGHPGETQTRFMWKEPHDIGETAPQQR